MTQLSPWGFYGRQNELTQLRGILSRQRWFFVQIAGRRRIGKTSGGESKVIGTVRASKSTWSLSASQPSEFALVAVSATPKNWRVASKHFGKMLKHF